MRTQDEIGAETRRLASSGEDTFGWRQEVVLSALDYEHLCERFRDLEPPMDISRAEWDRQRFVDEDAVRAAAVSYLDFAFGKARDHRGLSASRSLDKMVGFLWLLGLDDPLDEMLDAPHAQYGVPALAIAAKALGVAFPLDPMLVNMSNGKPCEPECEDGCGR